MLDLTSTLGGAYCARLLSAGGVAVTRAEPPGGHWLRGWSASGAPIPDGGTGALFGWLAGGQSSVTVDPGAPGDVADLLAWAATFDAVLWTPGGPLTGPGRADLEAVRSAAPDGVIAAITPFGVEGPWSDRPATEFTLQALSGAPALRGSRAWPPLTSGGQHGEWMIGVFSAVATQIGLRRRARSGRGGVVDISSLECLIMTQLFNPITQETMREGRRPQRQKATVADVVESKDGWVGFAVVNRLQHWHDFCAMIGQPDWAADPGLDAPVNRSERSDELNPVIRAWTTARTTAEIVELATLMRIPATDIGHGASIPRMDHFAARRFYDLNPTGGFRQPAPPYHLEPPVPGVGECRAAPDPGPAIAGRPRPSPPPRTDPDGPATGSAPADWPFEGLRVADFTSFWAGPFLTHTLGMFGADVVHVESTVRPDGARLMGYRPPAESQWWEWSSYFQATNTNKRGITLDMGADEGRDLARRLVARSDVIVENYSPRVLDSWGLAYEDVAAINPAVIMVRMPAFGLSGPWRDRTGFAMTMEQVSGMAWLTGFPEHQPAALFGPCDPGAGLHALLGLLAALEERDRTGRGRLVEAPMVAGALNVAGEQVIEHSAYGALLTRSGNTGPAAAPQNCYRTRDTFPDTGESRWVAIAVVTDRQWSALVGALGSSAWAGNPAWATVAGRRADRAAIDRELAGWCAERGVDEIVDRLWPAGVAVAAVVHPSEQLGFEQLHARGFFEEVLHPVTGSSTHVTYPFRLPGTSGPVHRRRAPTLGEHNAEVIGGRLGLTEDEVAGLEARGIIGTALPGRAPRGVEV